MKKLIETIKQNYPECEISKLKNKKMSVDIKTNRENISQKGIEVSEFADKLEDKFSHLDITIDFIISAY